MEYSKALGIIEDNTEVEEEFDVTEPIDNGDGSVSMYVSLAKGSSFNNSLFDEIFEINNSIDMFGSSGKEAIAKEKIRKTLFYFDNEPMVYKCITLLSQLANDSFKISCENKETEKAVNSWWKDVNGESFIAAFFLEYFRSGNVPILKTEIPYVSKSSEIKNPGSLIPAGYTILNPLNITIKNAEVLSSFSNAYLKIGNSITSNSNTKKQIKKLLNLSESSRNEDNDEIYLDPNIFTFITKDKQPYETWAMPLTSHAFEALGYKRELREMDKSTIRGVKNRILKVTIGNDNFPVLDSAELKALAQKFKGPSKNLTIFWNHTLQIEYIEPNMDSLSIEKYEPALEDIRCCFGIGKALVGEQSSSTGNNVLNLKGLIEILDEAQKSFSLWLQSELKKLCKAMGKDDEIDVGFGKLNLKDENEYIRVIMQLVDRQIISYETAVETIGYQFPREIQRLKKEQKLREKENILTAQKAPTQQSGNEEKNKSKLSGQEGRPTVTPNKEGERKESQNKPKTPSKIKTVSSVIEKYLDKSFSIATASTMTKNSKVKTIGRALKSALLLFYDENEASEKHFKAMSAAREYAKNFEDEDILEQYKQIFSIIFSK